MRSLTIGKKLYLAFGIVVLLMMIMGGVSIYRMNHITATYDKLVSTYQKIGYEAKDVKAALLSARRYEKDFIERHDRTDVERMDKTIEGMKADLNGMTKDCAALGLDDVGKNLKIALKAADSYYGAFGEMTTLIMAQGDEGTGIQGNLRKLSDDLEGAVKQTGSTDLTLLYLLLRKHENDYLLLKDEQYVEKAGKVVKTMDNMLKFMEPEVAAGIKKVSHAYLAVLGDFAANIATVSEQYAVMRQAALDIENGVLAVNTRIDEIVAAKMKEVHVSKDATLDELYILCGLVLLTGIVLSWYAVRSITRPVARAVAGLNRGSEQVASAANQVSAASQQLAEGASDQAASIEETSSSLEEMASMTRQNAEHANQADALMKDTNIIVAEANRSMDALTVSMEDISRASDETSKIIKTIDEIAFQTNLLALNAAVEAARAGEAGAGFAVVADEVRNLAMRAADAAKNTSTLIEDTVSKIAAGSQLVAGTNASFDKVALSSEKVAALISEISSASSEQSQGISQINRAVTEMDKIVQQNATNAEASAEASQAMNAQAGHMKAMVEELTALIKREVMAARPRKAKTVGRPAAAKGGIGCAKRPLSAAASPEKVIPLDHDREDF